jgi:uncharacterized repeat protein (TIGR02543 family)
MPASNLTLFAKWDVNSYRINFYPNQGVLTTTSINYLFEQSLPVLEVPTREGHTFQGWFLDVSFSQPFDYQRMPSRQLDVFAKWEINSYILTINNNNGSAIDSTVDSKSITVDRRCDSASNKPSSSIASLARRLINMPSRFVLKLI